MYENIRVSRLGIQATLDTSNFRGLRKRCRVISSSRQPILNAIATKVGENEILLTSSINRSPSEAIKVISMVQLCMSASIQINPKSHNVHALKSLGSVFFAQRLLKLIFEMHL